jgi:hypothetical protein
MRPSFYHQRNHFDDCIEGWLEDQPEQRQLEFENVPRPNVKRRVMSDTPIQPWAAGPLERPGSPSKRKRTSESNSGSQWVEQISRFDGDCALSSFTEPTTSAPLYPEHQAPPRASEIDGFSWTTQALRYSSDHQRNLMIRSGRYQTITTSRRRMLNEHHPQYISKSGNCR